MHSQKDYLEVSALPWICLKISNAPNQASLHKKSRGSPDIFQQAEGFEENAGHWEAVIRRVPSELEQQMLPLHMRAIEIVQEWTVFIPFAP